MLFEISSKQMRGERPIAGQSGQYGGSPGPKPQPFGRIDPFVLFAVLPMLIIAAISFWGGIAVLGIVLVLLAILIVVGDSWANRPSGKRGPAPRYR
jgi:hypothetical protein